MLTTSHENKFKIALKKEFSRGSCDAFVQFISIHLDPIPRGTGYLRGILHPTLFLIPNPVVNKVLILVILVINRVY